MTAFAIANPDLFARIAIVYEDEINEDGINHTRLAKWNVATDGAVLQMLETAKLEIWDCMKGRGPK